MTLAPITVFNDPELVLANIAFEFDGIVVTGDGNVDFLTRSSGFRFLTNILGIFGLQQITTSASMF